MKLAVNGPAYQHHILHLTHAIDSSFQDILLLSECAGIASFHFLKIFHKVESAQNPKHSTLPVLLTTLCVRIGSLLSTNKANASSARSEQCLRILTRATFTDKFRDAL